VKKIKISISFYVKNIQQNVYILNNTETVTTRFERNTLSRNSPQVSNAMNYVVMW